MNPDHKESTNLPFFEEELAQVYIKGELVGETTLLREVPSEPRIELFWQMVDDTLGFMERIVLPTGKEVLFNQELNKIDFEPLKEYIGSICHYYVDKEYRWSRTLQSVEPNEDGIMALFFAWSDDMEEEFRQKQEPGIEMSEEE